MAEQETRTHFRDLLASRRAELRLSYAKLDKLCVDPETGERAKGSWLHRVELGENVIPPSLPVLRAIAVGYQLPLAVVQDAAGRQFFGIDPVSSESGAARALVQEWERLDDEGRERVRQLVEAWAKDAAPRSEHDGR